MSAPVQELATRTVRTRLLDDPGPLLDLLPPDGAVAWVTGGEGLVGWGEVARLEVRGPDRFAVAAAWWEQLVGSAAVRDDVGLPGCGPVAFGSFSFDPDAPSVLVVPAVVVGSRDGRAWTTTWDGSRPALRRTPAAVPQDVVVDDRSGGGYATAVAEAVRRIGRGELAKVVLARSVDVRAAAPVDVRAPLRRLASGYPECWTFLVDGLLGATPEMLVRLQDGVARSRVLAGTLRRPSDDVADGARALARSRKDLEEHAYAVASVADALVPHCSAVDVPDAPFVLHLPNVMHLATDVAGAVDDGSTSLDLVASLHPSAAVCGTPTAEAFELISEVERLDRGRYAGPVGWLGADGDGEWGLALRCAQQDPDDPARLRLFAGCGVVAGSVPDDELAESNAKLLPVLDALGARPA